MVEDTDKWDLRWVSGEKVPIWEAQGGIKKDILEACRRAGSLMEGADSKGGWTDEFMHEGGRWMGEARSPAHASRKNELFRRASTYFGIAKYPFIEGVLKKDAYARQRTALSEDRKYFPYRYQDARIPFMDGEIVGRFAVPGKEITLPEAVLLTGDVDMAKEDLHDIESRVVASGMSCLSIDLPGTGESAWKLSDHTLDVYSAAVKYLMSRGDVDVNRIGVFGLGMGGYWSLLVAAERPEIKGVVSCGTPAQHAFDPDSLNKLPSFLKKTFAFAMGLDVSSALAALSGSSILKKDRLMGYKCPTLSINGSSDPWVPIDDLFVLREEGGIAQDEWVFREDGHCAPFHYKEWMPRAVNWLANTLGGRERVPAPDIKPL